MKKFLYFLFFICSTSSIVSCNKAYNCDCTTVPVGGTYLYEYKRTNQNRVEKLCEEAENALNSGVDDFKYVCTVKEV
jgi:hypothetical protein